MNKYNLKPGDKVRIVDMEGHPHNRYNVGDIVTVFSLDSSCIELDDEHETRLYYDRVVPVTEDTIQLWPL